MRRLPEYAIPPPLDSNTNGQSSESDGDQTTTIVSSGANVAGVLICGVMGIRNGAVDAEWDNVANIATVSIPAGLAVTIERASFVGGARVMRLLAGTRMLAMTFVAAGATVGNVNYRYDFSYRVL